MTDGNTSGNTAYDNNNYTSINWTTGGTGRTWILTLYLHLCNFEVQEGYVTSARLTEQPSALLRTLDSYRCPLLTTYNWLIFWKEDVNILHAAKIPAVLSNGRFSVDECDLIFNDLPFEARTLSHLSINTMMTATKTSIIDIVYTSFRLDIRTFW